MRPRLSRCWPTPHGRLPYRSVDLLARRAAGCCLGLLLLAAAMPAVAPASESGEPEPTTWQPDATPSEAPDAGPFDDEPAAAGPIDAHPSDDELVEPEPLAPIETRSSIRVNANVSLPQDI